jgi:hypothetical protein
MVEHRVYIFKVTDSPPTLHYPNKHLYRANFRTRILRVLAVKLHLFTQAIGFEPISRPCNGKPTSSGSTHSL